MITMGVITPLFLGLFNQLGKAFVVFADLLHETDEAWHFLNDL